ncbi:MAG: hypothetical protein JWP87_5846 [Labilithrix sp.]|jgi:hypothetical protein|nr:hypothetical protein [Labilithrix sp.]
MKLANVALVSTMAVLGLVAVGCSSKNDNSSADGNLATNEALLVSDNDEVDDQDETLESGIEDPLSGADPSDPGAPADGTDDAALLANVKANPGKWFKPAGCILTTLTGNVAKHEFKDCSGPYGFASFTGTVTSTYVRGNGTLTITHEATGFKANGASISGKRVVVVTKTGTLITKHRTGTWTGTTKKGKDFSHDADFTVTYDTAAKCITRDGSAQTSVASRDFTRSITGFERCGIGSLGCPQSGEIVLTRSRGDNTASVTIDFLGGPDYTVTGPKGGTFNRKLVCNPTP